MTVTIAAPAPKNSVNISLHLVLRHISDCDNASNNDTMIEYLSTLIENFPSTTNQTRCSTHILNLVAISILCQFEPWKKTGDDEGEDVDDATKTLAALTLKLKLGDSAELADDTEEVLGVDKDLEADDNNNDVLKIVTEGERWWIDLREWVGNWGLFICFQECAQTISKTYK